MIGARLGPARGMLRGEQRRVVTPGKNEKLYLADSARCPQLATTVRTRFHHGSSRRYGSFGPRPEGPWGMGREAGSRHG